MTSRGRQEHSSTVAARAGELGRQVRELREQCGWTQAQLAAMAGMTQPSVARFEAGGTIPTLVVLARLAAALNADLVVDVRPRPTLGRESVPPTSRSL